MEFPIDDAQRKAARIVGATYLATMATAVFGEVAVRGRLIVRDDPAATTRNILANEGLFRLGIASELVTFVGVVVLLAGLHVVLRPVSPPLARFAASLRLVEASLSAVLVLSSLFVLRLVSGAGYLRALGADGLQAWVVLYLAAHDAGFSVAFVFTGLGSAVFSCLLLRSRYVPRALGALGVAASLLLAGGSFAFLLLPGLERFLAPAYFAPMFVFEVGLGLWLLVRGLPAGPQGAPAAGAAARGSA